MKTHPGGKPGQDSPVTKRDGMDRTGQDQLYRNAMFSWAGHLVFVVGGFIMPRMIDRHIGQAELGLWDFAWSLVHYFEIVGLGIGSSVNRYVAKYGAARNITGLRRAASSVFVVQALSGMAVVLLSLMAGWAVQVFFSDRLGGDYRSAQAAVVLLGMALAVQTVFNVFRGVISGCHRWGAHNALNAGIYSLTLVCMIAGLMSGGKLVSLSLAYFGVTVLGEVVRAHVAYRICPELSVSFKYWRFSQARSMLHFGLKNMVAWSGNLFVDQGIAILVASFLGPAALAVFARPMSLVRHLDTIVTKFAMILIPTAGAIQRIGSEFELQNLLLRTTRVGVLISLFAVLLLSVMADPIIRLWMGSHYESGPVLPLLAVGYLLPISQRTVYAVLTGLNMHGRFGLVSSVVSILVFVSGAYWFWVAGWTLTRSAVLLAASFTVSQGLILPVYACGKLNIPIGRYLYQVFILPLAYALPLACVLVFSRMALGHNPLLSLCVGCVATGFALVSVYWNYFLAPGTRAKLKEKVGSWASRESGKGATIP